MKRDLLSQNSIGNSRALGASRPIISSDSSGIPLSRNISRLKNEMLMGEQILGESETSSTNSDYFIPLHSGIGRPYLPNDPREIFTEKVHSPPLLPWKIRHSLSFIKRVCASPVPPPKPSPFKHERSYEAAVFNSILLRKNDYDLQQIIDKNPRSTISPGSEFRPVEILETFLDQHPFWPKINDIMRHGAFYKFQLVTSDEDRCRENEAILNYGNHSSAQKRPEALIKVSEKDTAAGYSFPVTFDCCKKIRHGRVGPLGVAQHAGITESGDIVMKDRLAHDQSFSFGHAPSLNQAVDESELIDLVFGWCIDRIIHQVVALRLEFPDKRILVCKFDWGSAYRRINGDGVLIANTITTDASGEFANLLTRLTFGGSPHPAMFSTISEATCDFCNDLVSVKRWSPAVCKSPLQDKMGPVKRLEDDIPFAQGRPLAVQVLTSPESFVDVYLDDMVQLFLDTEENLRRSPGIVPLALHLLVRPTAPDEPIKRSDILAADKMMAEGSPSEEMRVLGWLIDTRRLLLRLPNEKFINWSRLVQSFLDPQRKNFKFTEIESLIGKMDNACKGIPLARYFINRIRAYKDKLISDHAAKQDPEAPAFVKRPKPWYRYKMPENLKPDLQVWLKLLNRANEGISLNLLTCRQPTNVALADSCPFGMGGFSLRTGRAWHVRLDPAVVAMASNAQDMEDDPNLGSPDLKLSNNLFEFICQVVTIWLDCIDGVLGNDDCILALSDSSSATGWMHRASYGTNKPHHRKVSEKLVDLSLQHRFALHPEHVPGKANQVTDVLSRTFDCCDIELTQLIHSRFPEQIPSNFKILPLPTEIQSWISSVAPQLPVSSTAESNQQVRVKTGHGDDGTSTYDCSNSPATPFWTESRPSVPEPSSSALSCKDYGTGITVATMRETFGRALLKKPLASWQRSFGITTGRAPATSRDATGFIPLLNH